MAISSKHFTEYLVSKPNRDLLEIIKNKTYYTKTQVTAVQKEILKRKENGKMRKDAGKKKK